MTQVAAIEPATFVQERPLITIEFAPDIHPDETEYIYEHPQFVFGDRVTITDHFPEQEYTVCALELIESKTPSGKLLNQPRWKYKVTDVHGNSFHKEESTLTRYTEKTCSSCPRFQNYNEPNGRGWCNQFDHQTRTHHIKTDDCVLNGALDRSNEVFLTEVIELDRDGYPMEEAASTGYFATDFVTNSNEPF